jgi:hypothetical protein
MCIDRSGMTLEDWSATVPWRDPRTVRRWLSGETEVPEVVARPLRAMVAARQYAR